MRTTTKSPGHWLRSAVSLFITAAMVLGIVLTIPFSGLTAFAQLHDLTAPDFRENLWIDYDFTENMDDTANEIVTNKADDIGDGLTAERFNASFSATQNGMVNPRNVAFQPNYESGSVHFDDGTMEDKDSIRFRNDDTDRGNYWDGSRPHLYMRGQTAGEMWGIFERLADAYTISMWVKMDDANVHKYSTLFTAGNFNGNNEAALNVHLWAGRIRVRYKEQGGSTTMVDTDARLTGGYWQLITVAQQENNVKIYMDGTLLRSINDASLVGDGFGFGYDPNTSVSSRALWMDIGGNSADLDGSRYESSMVGNMGSFRIYKGQLTDEDVQALYKYHADNAKDGVPLARRSANAIDWAESVLPNGEDVVASWRVIDYKGEKAFSANYDEGWVATASDAEVRRKNYQGDQTDGRITTAMHLTAEHRSKVAEVIADTGANTPLYIKYMFKTEGRLRRSDITMDNGEFGAGFMHNYGGVAGATGSPNDFRFGPKMMQRALIPDYGTNEGAGNLSDPNVSRQADILTNPRLHRGTTSGIGSTPRKEGRRINSAWDWALYDGKWISSTSTGNWGNPAASAGLTAGGLNL
ncbi:MAG: LamG domain-containing protein, partial [Oscillospiraceae bacterium]|nr:LamG domain-containing protein [Oscillospiraceae bacterium]